MADVTICNCRCHTVEKDFEHKHGPCCTNCPICGQERILNWLAKDHIAKCEEERAKQQSISDQQERKRNDILERHFYL
ncbi:hypothetical protein IPM19_01085 [bacterium]|nr:MAG: hypothetical protein IPM19_01085 [bacterium]